MLLESSTEGPENCDFVLLWPVSKFQIFCGIFCPFLLGCFARGQKRGQLSFFTGGSQVDQAQHWVTETAQQVKALATSLTT